MDNGIKRATGLLVIEVVNSNPNGDPDRGSEPRQRDDGRGEITPVSFKRKLRDLLDDHDSPFFQSLPEEFAAEPDRYCILEHRGRNRTKIINEEMTVGASAAKFDQKAFLNSPFVKKYWDARVFGNTFLEEKDRTGEKSKLDKEYIKSGVVQMSIGLSISPILVTRHTNTSKAGVQEGKKAGMAPLGFQVVRHGVYCMPFFVNPNYAHKSGCTSRDIALLKLLIPVAYDLTRSAIRPDVRLRHAWYIEHKNPLGSCPDYLLLEALTPKRIGDAKIPSESWTDYEDAPGLPDALLARVETAADLVNP